MKFFDKLSLRFHKWDIKGIVKEFTKMERRVENQKLRRQNIRSKYQFTNNPFVKIYYFVFFRLYDLNLKENERTLASESRFIEKKKRAIAKLTVRLQ